MSYLSEGGYHLSEIVHCLKSTYILEFLLNFGGIQVFSFRWYSGILTSVLFKFGNFGVFQALAIQVLALGVIQV